MDAKENLPLAIDGLGCDFADMGQGRFKMVLNDGVERLGSVPAGGRA